MALSVSDMTVMRDAAKAAYLKAFSAMKYSISSGNASRSLDRQALKDLKDEWEYWEQRIDEANGDSRRIKFVTPRY